MTEQIDIRHGAILYDDGCGVCRGFFGRFGARLEAHGFHLVGLHSPVARKLCALPVETLMEEVHNVTPPFPRGEVIRGLDAVLYIGSTIAGRGRSARSRDSPEFTRCFGSATARLQTTGIASARACGIDRDVPNRAALAALTIVPLILLTAAIALGRMLAPWGVDVDDRAGDVLRVQVDYMAAIQK